MVVNADNDSGIVPHTLLKGIALHQKLKLMHAEKKKKLLQNNHF